jgi:hypothetical protein
MSSEKIRQQLGEAISALRASRDAAARSAQALRADGASDMADNLDLLAADQDKKLASLLRADEELREL